jgi:hypothetical protein
VVGLSNLGHTCGTGLGSCLLGRNEEVQKAPGSETGPGSGPVIKVSETVSLQVGKVTGTPDALSITGKLDSAPKVHPDTRYMPGRFLSLPKIPLLNRRVHDAIPANDICCANQNPSPPFFLLRHKS